MRLASFCAHISSAWNTIGYERILTRPVATACENNCKPFPECLESKTTFLEKTFFLKVDLHDIVLFTYWWHVIQKSKNGHSVKFLLSPTSKICRLSHTLNSRSASVQPLVTHALLAEDSYLGYRIPKKAWTVVNVWYVLTGRQFHYRPPLEWF